MKMRDIKLAKFTDGEHQFYLREEDRKGAKEKGYKKIWRVFCNVAWDGIKEVAPERRHMIEERKKRGF